MIEVLTMLGEVQRRYVIDADRFTAEWREMHRALAGRLLDNPRARVRLELPGDAPYLEYGASLPTWAEHPELSGHRWLMAYDAPGRDRPVYAGWLVPHGHETAYYGSGCAMIAALTGGEVDGTYLIPEIQAADPEPLLIGGYTPDAIRLAARLQLLAQLVSESVSAMALEMLGG